MDLREPLIEATKKLRALRDQLDELQARAQEPIAIIAAACRLPGGIDSPEAYWQLLDEGRDAIEPFPPSRWNADDLYDADPDAPGKTFCTQGGFVRDVDRFDAGFFGIAPREAETMDPAQRLALECVWEAIERAGIPPAELSQRLTGVYLGGVGSDYEPWGGRRGMAGMDGYGFTGRDSSVLSGRISYTFGLQGPSFAVNTACSSSLVALHLACRGLRAGECDFAFCGGSQVMTTPGVFVEFSRLRGVARDGRCKSFSDDADGAGWAEGCTVLLLQRLSDAQRDGRRVLAVVRGTAINQDGRSQGLTAPNGPAQERVIERALAESGLTGADIDAVEAHGTGTPLGDPIEANALAAVFGRGRPADHPLYIGSAKSNIGHTQAASGTAGVLKMALALAHGKLPRSLHSERLNRRIAWDQSGLHILQATRAWPRGSRVRRAGVNSFGLSGTNAHVILEEAPDPPAEAVTRERPVAHVPLVVSAADDAALAAQAERLADHLEQRPAAALDLAFSLATGRAPRAARLALAVPTDAPPAALATALREFARGRAPAGVHARTATRRPGKLVMLFSGQGSQRPEMGKQLHGRDPVFRAAFDEVCAELDRALPRPLREVMFAPPGSDAALLLDQTEYAQPALFALEVALYRRWERWGIVPDVVLGHSVGELAAAHVAEVLTLADACALVAARGRLMQRARADGAMYSIGTRVAEVAEELFGLEDRLSIAAINGPEQTVISGDAAAAEAIAAAFQQRGKRVHRLRVSHAFHSPHMNGILEDYRAVARTLAYHPPRIALIGNLTGAAATAEQVGTAEYWVRQVRGAVRFRDAIRTAEAAGADRYIECGPGAVLAGLAAACAADGASFVASLQDGRGEAAALTDALASAFVAGATPRWDEVFAGLGARRIDAPTYGFQRTRYWLAGAGQPERDLDGAGLARVEHELLGAELPLPDGGSIFTGRISRAHLPWLGDHRVFDHVVVPGMCLLELVLTAGRRAGVPVVRNLTLESPLFLDAGSVQLQLAIDPADEHGRRAVRVHARPVGRTAWTRHASGTLEREGAPAPAPAERAAPLAPAGAEVVELAGLYDRLAARGLAYGPAFRGLQELARRGPELFGRVVLPAPLLAHGYAVHPALLDAGLHAILAATADAAEPRIPFELEQARLAQAEAELREPRELRVHVAMGQADAALAFYDPAGAPVLEARISLRTVSRDKLAAAPAPAAQPRAGELYRLHWTPRPPTGGPPRAAACVVVGSGPLSNEVAAALRGAGVGVVRLDTVADLPERLRRHDGISTVVRVLDPGGREAGADVALEATASLLAELQAWTADASLADYRYALITSRAVATAPGGMGSLAHAPLWGLVRAIRNEHADRAWLLLDTDATEASHEALGAALFSADEPEVALRKGDRLVPRLQRADAGAPTAPQRLAAGGTVLVTGGTAGLGAEVARHLAGRHGVRHLVLVSRRGPAAPGASELVAELAALGSQATVAACDVADRGAVERLLAAVPAAHPLTAVVHCAAVLDDAPVGSVSPERIARAFGPKVAGAWHLHQLTQRRELAAFVLFSSIAGLVGNKGQSVYSAANAFLDALAADRQAQGLAAQSLAWGAWAEVGMVARLPAHHQERMRRSGLLALPPAAAFELMDRAMGSREHLLVPLAIGEPGGATPLGRLLSVGAPPAAAPKPAPAAALSLRDHLDAAAPPERARLLLELVRTEATAVLKLADPRGLHEDRPLEELGVDSLMAVDLRRRLERRLKMRLPATLVFDQPSCRLLVQYLLTQWSAS